MDSTTHSQSDLVQAVVSVLTPDLLKPRYRAIYLPSNPTRGHCYVATEALWHLIQDRDWQPHWARDGDDTHWWLQHRHTNMVMDPTADQYYRVGRDPPYRYGIGCGFLTQLPSRRAQEIIRRVHAL